MDTVPPSGVSGWQGGTVGVRMAGWALGGGGGRPGWSLLSMAGAVGSEGPGEGRAGPQSRPTIKGRLSQRRERERPPAPPRQRTGTGAGEKAEGGHGEGV